MNKSIALQLTIQKARGIQCWCLLQICLNCADYMISNSLNTFLSFSTDSSTCSKVWFAISAYLTSVSWGAHAGGITGLMNTPSSNARATAMKVLSVLRT